MQDLDATQVFKALGVQSRMEIFELLKREGPMVVKAIAESLGMTASAVSQHLKVLKAVGIVSAKRQGFWIPHEVDPSVLADCAGKLVKICACPSCEERGVDDQSTELEKLLSQREELLSELQKVETRIEMLRS